MSSPKVDLSICAFVLRCLVFESVPLAIIKSNIYSFNDFPDVCWRAILKELVSPIITTKFVHY